HYELRFFFSSRRRHTRSKRDWSSDVCSSDLCKLFAGGSVAVKDNTVDPTGTELRIHVSRPSRIVGSGAADVTTIAVGIVTTTDTLCAVVFPRFVTSTR